MSITQISDYASRAKARLLQQFKVDCAPNVNLLVDVLMSEVQAIETELFNLLNLRNVTDAVGEQLDIIGNIVGVGREGNTDDDYRAIILVQIGVNNGGGTHTNLVQLIDVLSAATVIDIRETFPAALEIFVDLDDLSIPLILSLRRAIAATVSYTYTFTVGGTPFAFAGDTVGDGWGSSADPSLGGFTVGTIFG